MVRRRRRRKQRGGGFLAKRACKKMVKKIRAQDEKYKWSPDGSILVRTRIPSYEEWKKKYW